MTLAFTEERPEVGSPCVKANKKLLKKARETGVPVFYVTPSGPDVYPDDYHGTTKTSSGESDRSPEEQAEWDKRSTKLPQNSNRKKTKLYLKSLVQVRFSTCIWRICFITTILTHSLSPE